MEEGEDVGDEDGDPLSSFSLVSTLYFLSFLDMYRELVAGGLVPSVGGWMNEMNNSLSTVADGETLVISPDEVIKNPCVHLFQYLNAVRKPEFMHLLFQWHKYQQQQQQTRQ